MAVFYFKRHFNESRTETNENWGTCIFYFETNESGEVKRQIEVYENGKILQYSNEFIEDKFGGLADQSIDLVDFEEFIISKEDFEYQWEVK